MNGYPEFLSAAALVGGVCAGFILAQSPRQRSTQLATLLVLGATWWAFCESRWNAAPDAARALLWMRLSTPGWAFIGGLLPHLSGRYFDSYPTSEMKRHQSLSYKAASIGYAVGVIALLAAALQPHSLFGEIVRVPWGWSYVPATALLGFFAIAFPCASLAFPMAVIGFRSSLAVAPRVQRIAVHVGMAIPGVTLALTELALPIARVPFPRLGSTSYVIFGLIVLGSGLRYGLTFFTPNRFSEEILDTLHEGVAMLTASGRIRRANRGFCNLSGHSLDALVGMPIESLIAGASVASLRELEEESAELCDADGERVPVSLSAASLQDRQGNAMGMVVVLRDLREIEQLRRQILTQARLAAIGELAAGVAHELNNPLAFVRANLGLLEAHVKSLSTAAQKVSFPTEHAEIADEAREIIEECFEGVDRATEVVHGVRRFTDAAQTRRETADLNELLEDALAMAKLESGSSQLAIEFAPRVLPLLPCAPQDLRQALLNLLVNAVEAMGGTGRIEVSTRAEAGVVIAEIADSGPGMSPETLARVFDPFYTTKAVGDGRGLGLTIAWHVVEAHAGRIEVESSPGAGTLFRVHLPALT